YFVFQENPCINEGKDLQENQENNDGLKKELPIFLKIEQFIQEKKFFCKSKQGIPKDKTMNIWLMKTISKASAAKQNSVKFFKNLHERTKKMLKNCDQERFGIFKKNIEEQNDKIEKLYGELVAESKKLKIYDNYKKIVMNNIRYLNKQISKKIAFKHCTE
ncbi:hypothetical protein EDEG_03384, partial [Edhazardia aedis USNM 41457]